MPAAPAKLRKVLPALVVATSIRPLPVPWMLPAAPMTTLLLALVPRFFRLALPASRVPPIVIAPLSLPLPVLPAPSAIVMLTRPLPALIVVPAAVVMLAAPASR